MRFFALARAIALLAVVAAPAIAQKAPASAQDAPAASVGAIRILAPWARATPPGAQVAAGYLTIVNDGAAADRFVRGSTPAAGSLSVHEMSMDGGVMRMRSVAGGLEIKPGARVALTPGGYHLMFEKIGAPLKVGDRVRTTLVFEKAGAVDVDLPVGAVGSMAPPQ